MKMLFIGSNDLVYDQFSKLCASELGGSLEQSFSPIQASESLESETYELIILYYPQADYSVLFESLKEYKKEIPILFACAESDFDELQKRVPGHALCGTVCYDVSPEQVNRCLKKIWSITQNKKRRSEGYCSMPSSFFDFAGPAPFDIYLKLSDEKHLLLARSGENLEPEDLERFASEDYLYLKASDFLSACTALSAKLEEKVGNNEKISSEHLQSYSQFGHSSVAKLAKEIGLKEEVLEVANSSIYTSKTLFQKSPKLKGHIQNILKGTDFVSEHTLLTVMISLAIAKETGNNSDISYNKLTVSAFFHDIFMDDEEIARASTIDETYFNSRRITKYKLHPVKAVEALARVQGLPPDVDRIIMLHHEKPDGSGFPRGQNWKTIFPLGAIFIVAEDFAKSLFEAGGRAHFVRDLLIEFSDVYSQGNFALALEGLYKALGVNREQLMQKQKKLA